MCSANLFWRFSYPVLLLLFTLFYKPTSVMLLLPSNTRAASSGPPREDSNIRSTRTPTKNNNNDSSNSNVEVTISTVLEKHAQRQGKKSVEMPRKHHSSVNLMFPATTKTAPNPPHKHELALMLMNPSLSTFATASLSKLSRSITWHLRVETNTHNSQQQ